eukprot:GFYU01005530.1.p1 GENE.GFYU01005530.1~~GFYU01005530.1.p1  ORF type:complete len:244 (+),score=61.20 GFYU01005530.1:163-894(+)
MAQKNVGPVFKDNFGCIPGYTGHVHKEKYVFGLTYGDATRRLQGSAAPPVEKGPNPYHTTVRGAYTKTTCQPVPAFPDDYNDTSQEGIVPGYTGYVSGMSNVFGKTYGSSTRFALANLSPPRLRKARNALAQAQSTTGPKLRTTQDLANLPARDPVDAPQYRPSAVYSDPNRDWSKLTHMEYDMKKSMNNTSIQVGDRQHWGPENYTSTNADNYVAHPRVAEPPGSITKLMNWPGDPPQYLPG